MLQSGPRLSRSLATVVLIVIASKHVDSAQVPVTCSAGIAILNEEGKIRCHFHRDINESQHNFNIVRYPASQSQQISDLGVYIILCNWGRSRNVECKVEEGHRFNNKVSSELTVSILNVTRVNAGVYVCQLVPDSGIPVTPCSLTVRSLNGKCSTDELCALAQQQESPRETHWYIIVVILVVLLLVLVGALIYMIIRFCMCPTRKHTPLVYQLETKPTPVQRHCLLCVRKKNSHPDIDDDDEQIPMRVTIPYPPNTVNKTTQIFVDVQDKSFQIGDSTARNIVDADTQVSSKDIPKEKKINKKDRDVKVGNSLRYDNPQLYHLGKPPVVPLPKDPSAKDIEYACDVAISAVQASLNTHNSQMLNDKHTSLITKTAKVQMQINATK